MKRITSIYLNRRAATGLFLGFGVILAIGGVDRADQAIADEPTAGAIVTAITKPSIERQLKFALPGIISEVTVKDGDAIKVHQPLIRQDSRQDAEQLKSDLKDADSSDKVEYSQADLASKAVDLKRKQELFTAHASSQTEVDQADLAVKLAAAQVKLAVIEHEQKGFEAAKEKIKIDQMTIYSPINGIVEKLTVGEGEMGDPQAREGAIIVGQWNPLWLEMHLPSGQAAQLKRDDTISVRYDGGQWQPAKIVFFEKVDAASDTQMVRMELANPDNRSPGLHMQVKLPATIASVK